MYLDHHLTIKKQPTFNAESAISSTIIMESLTDHVAIPLRAIASLVIAELSTERENKRLVPDFARDGSNPHVGAIHVSAVDQALDPLEFIRT
jgi:hypothetical protein